MPAGASFVLSLVVLHPFSATEKDAHGGPTWRRSIRWEAIIPTTTATKFALSKLKSGFAAASIGVAQLIPSDVNSHVRTAMPLKISQNTGLAKLFTSVTRAVHDTGHGTLRGTLLAFSLPPPMTSWYETYSSSVIASGSSMSSSGTSCMQSSSSPAGSRSSMNSERRSQAQHSSAFWLRQLQTSSLPLSRANHSHASTLIRIIRFASTVE